jgi:hypothetical protein
MRAIAAGAGVLLVGEVVWGSLGAVVEAIDLMQAIVVLLMLFYLAVASGSLIITPPTPLATPKRKVFVIGLSRTGTTSITTALSSLGYTTYHFCAELVKLRPHRAPTVNRVFADAFDAQTDFAPALVYQELAALYPDARFILTTRKPTEWGEAMVRFTQ